MPLGDLGERKPPVWSRRKVALVEGEAQAFCTFASNILKNGYRNPKCVFRCVDIASNNKKDGYRQQNVRQRQKLISIIDYNVRILEYLQPFWRYSTSKNGLTLKSGYGVLQGH